MAEELEALPGARESETAVSGGGASSSEPAEERSAAPAPEVKSGAQDNPYAWMGGAESAEVTAAAAGKQVKEVPPSSEETSAGEPDEKPGAEAAPAHSPLVLELAAQLGVTAEEIAESSPKELERTVRAIQKRDGAWRAHLEEQAKQTTKPEQKPAQPEAEIDFGTNEDGTPRKVEDYDPGIIHAVKSVHAKANQRVQALEEKLRQAEIREQAAVFDAAVESLGDDFKGVFGDGPGRSLPADSPELQRRFLALQVSGIDFSKDPPALIRQKYKEAAARIFGVVPSKKQTEAQKKAAAEAEETKDRFRRGGVARPNARKAAEPAGDGKAIATAAEHLQALGYDVNDSRVNDKDLLNEFPK